MTGTPRERLLAAAVDYAAANGIGDRSLRQLAAALGTSHRMLIYHFGSMEGLLVAVVRSVEERQRAVLAELEESAASAGSLAELGRRFWQRVSDPSLWPHIRLFFELYGQALQDRPGTTPLLDGIVADWVRPVEALLRQYGLAPAAARARARLGLAVTRGLLLDLLATGDRPRVDEAMETFLATSFSETSVTSADQGDVQISP